MSSWLRELDVIPANLLVWASSKGLEALAGLVRSMGLDVCKLIKINQSCHLYNSKVKVAPQASAKMSFHVSRVLQSIVQP